MAEANGSSFPTGLRDGTKGKRVVRNTGIRTSRRKLTLVAIACLLNVLLWSSLLCITACVFQTVLDPKDPTNIVLVILNLVPAIATVLYTIFHTIFSIRQRVWIRQHNASSIKNTSYIAIRFAVSLCVLWLLTCGWNMIIVARRPLCIMSAPGLQRWEYGLTCQVSRIVIAFAMLSLIASFILFIYLNMVRRPFEAHLFRASSRQVIGVSAKPSESSASPPIRSTSVTYGYAPVAVSTPRANVSEISFLMIGASDGDESTLPEKRPIASLDCSSRTTIFTSNEAPPPIPAVFVDAQQITHKENSASIFYPSISHGHLTRPARLSGMVSSPGLSPISVPVQYSASAWKAVHPAQSSPLRSGSGSHTQLRELYSSSRNRYSRSSMSLTRPQRLSDASPWSSRSGSLDLERTDSVAERTASSREIAYAIVNGTSIPGTKDRASSPKFQHARNTSAPGSTMAGSQQPFIKSAETTSLKSLSTQPSFEKDGNLRGTALNAGKVSFTEPGQPSPTHSTRFLDRFSPDTSPDDDGKTPGHGLDLEIEARKAIKRKPVPIRRSWSGDRITDPAQAKAAMLRKMPKDIRVDRKIMTQKEENKKRYEEVKNKPLPRIAIL